MRLQTRIFLLVATLLILSLSCSINFDFEEPTATPQSAAAPPANPTIADQIEQPPTGTSAATQTPIPTAALSPTSETPQFNTQSINQASDMPKYTIAFEYPRLENTSVQAAFNTIIQTFRDTNIGDFHQEVDDNEEWRAENVPDFGNDLFVRYTTTYQDNKLASFRFDLSIYIAGAAHPGTLIHTITFDLTSGQEVELGQLFNPGSNYLDIIANYCKDDLLRQDLLAWEDGALPIEENYRNWNITTNGLLITFNDYQVAPHAAGIPEVTIPYGVLQPAANPGGLLGQFIQ